MPGAEHSANSLFVIEILFHLHPFRISGMIYGMGRAAEENCGTLPRKILNKEEENNEENQ